MSNADCDEYYDELEKRQLKRGERQRRREYLIEIAKECRVRFVVIAGGGSTFDPKQTRVYDDAGRRPLETKRKNE